MKIKNLILLSVLLLIPSIAFAQSQKITINIDENSFQAGQIAELKGSVDPSLAGKPVAVEVKDGQGQVIILRTVQPDENGNFVLKFKVPASVAGGELQVSSSVESEGETISESTKIEIPTDPKPTSNSLITCGEGTVNKNGICVPIQNSKSPQLGAKVGQWTKYSIDITTDSKNDFLKTAMEIAMSQAFSSSSVDIKEIEWVKSEITKISNGKVYVRNSIHEKNTKTDTSSDTTFDPSQPSALNWIISTNYKQGDVIFNDDKFGEVKVTGMKTKTYGNKSFETLEIKAEKSISDSGNIGYYRVIQYFDKNTGVMLETTLEAKIASMIVGSASVNMHVKSIDSYIPQPEGSGCLIATAAYGTELAPQVQLLREIRDNVLYNTGSGTTFMTGFNEFYYSFSPAMADLERQNPLFKEMVKITITPMLSTLSILNYVNIDSEQGMLGYGIGVILLNAGMYFVAPAIIIIKLQRKISNI